ncbi:hypothetical protein LMG23992_04252 [Cupriavidus laharis]|uniref:Uncharacterized protein n=1 Tax=Cupriavidus laharis TaxID=151654 RepID=A0ABN7Z3A8_9BURK|nr:hypothetical protein LMG23992_04252 [Cupriavidus laharis]
MFGPPLLLVTLLFAAYLLWADQNGRRYHKD